ncbi:hypothetical protein B0H11DRAFT_9014 [Mycena galericulata]|nr:hypothetical protein B0H11DRAFT_9014 [Mycena galericulata]
MVSVCWCCGICRRYVVAVIRNTRRFINCTRVADCEAHPFRHSRPGTGPPPSSVITSPPASFRSIYATQFCTSTPKTHSPMSPISKTPCTVYDHTYMHAIPLMINARTCYYHHHSFIHRQRTPLNNFTTVRLVFFCSFLHLFWPVCLYFIVAFNPTFPTLNFLASFLQQATKICICYDCKLLLESHSHSTIANSLRMARRVVLS